MASPRSEYGRDLHPGRTDQPGRFLRTVRSQGNSLVIAIPMELCRELHIGNGTPLVIERAGPYLVARVLDLMAPATIDEIEALRPPIKGQRGDVTAPAGMARAWREFLKQWKSQRTSTIGGARYGNEEA